MDCEIRGDGWSVFFFLRLYGLDDKSRMGVDGKRGSEEAEGDSS